MNDFQLRLISGEFCLCSNDYMLPIKRFAIGYTSNGPGDYTVHKYGEYDEICEWAKNYRYQMREFGFTDMANQVEVVDFEPDFPIDEINKALANTGYLGIILNKFSKSECI